ncbi:MAG: hypothetical protein AB6733_19130 [Clostridiaceae bacterium]
MGLHYWKVTKDWFSKDNVFTLSFLVLTAFMLLVIVIIFSKNRINRYNKKAGFFTISKDTLEGRIAIFMVVTLCFNIYMGIYTYISFIKLLVKWFK